jgi:hypothetical protein
MPAHGQWRGSMALGQRGGGGRRGTGRRGDRLSGGPWGVSWLTGGGPEVAVRGGSATASIGVQWQQKVEEEGAPWGGAGEDINTPSVEILGPITRSRAQQLNHQVNSFLCSAGYNIESRLLSNDLIVLRNQGEDHGGQTEYQEDAREPRRRAREGGKPIQFGIAKFESNSESRTTSYSN